MRHANEALFAIHDEWHKACKKAAKAQQSRTQYVIAGNCDELKLAMLIIKADAAKAYAEAFWKAYVEESNNTVSNYR